MINDEATNTDDDESEANKQTQPPAKVQKATTRSTTKAQMLEHEKDNNKNVAEQLGLIQKQITELNTKVTELQDTNDELKSTCKSLTDENEQLKNIVSQLQSTHAQLLNEMHVAKTNMTENTETILHRIGENEKSLHDDIAKLINERESKDNGSEEVSYASAVKQTPNNMQPTITQQTIQQPKKKTPNMISSKKTQTNH